MINTFTLLLLLLGVFSPTSYDRQPNRQWAWFRASSVTNDWAIDKGRADVTMDGKNFKATLWRWLPRIRHFTAVRA
jgi:hypothetical protein